MRRRGRAVVAGVIVAVVGCAAPASAQEPPWPTGPVRSWGPRLDRATATFASRSVWRGFDLGRFGLGAVADVGIWGRPVTGLGSWGVAVGLGAHAVPEPRLDAPARGRVAGRLAITRRLGGHDAFAGVVAETYHLPELKAEETGTELGVLVAGIPVPWLEEVWPTLDATVLRHVGRFEGTHVEIGLTLAPGLQNLGATMDARVHGNDYGGRAFQYRALEVGLGVGYDVVVGQELSFRLAPRAALMERGDRSTIGWFSLDITAIH